MTELGNIVKSIRKISLQSSEFECNELRKALSSAKKNALEINDQERAKYIWGLETALQIIENFLLSFKLLKKGEYYKSWCLLERIEIDIGFLHEHLTRSTLDKLRISLVEKLTRQFQSIFPYSIFMSPEILVREKKCNICDKIVDIRNLCGHRVGEIYNGEMCIRLVTRAQILSISFVREPSQKYSVPFLVDEDGKEHDKYDYFLVKWVIDRLQSPFDNWDVNLTAIRHPHEYFENYEKNAKCPCGSNSSYKDCCLLKEGVLRPHYEIYFSVHPPEDKPNIAYNYSNKNILQ